MHQKICTFPTCMCLIPIVLQHSHLLLWNSLLFFAIFTISQVKVSSMCSFNPANTSSAAFRGIRGTVRSSWIWNICQEYSSGAMVRILTNQCWINTMYLHSKQLIQKNYSLYKLPWVHLSIVPALLINCSCLSILDCTVLGLILSSPFSTAN